MERAFTGRHRDATFMTDHGFYVYGFAASETAPDLLHPGHEEIGPVRMYECGGLGAIASMVPPGMIEAGLSLEPPDPGWIVPRALHHEQVLRAAVQRTQVLPVRFGCVFATEAALVEAIERHRTPIEDFLQRMAGQEEWSLRVTLDEAQAVSFLLRCDPALSARYRALPDAPGTRYFLEKKLGEEARRVAVRAGKTAAENVYRVLVGLATSIKALPLRAGEDGGRHPMLRLAVLLDRDGRERMFAALDEAATDRGVIPLCFDPAGPLPLYHFCPRLGEPVP
ncbi:GvpL/GvpF family gas vesicle protein [Aquisphaera insulae]|uniref:GvpL/GvpF family gas vesicle protein n=1 Tax=Aquisphaera insulae TaxID=2712864 RepID=UPI0013ED26E5|nr:GvpL/GvpF family gas vesicle protein [Aquisphaera insulae]